MGLVGGLLGVALTHHPSILIVVPVFLMYEIVRGVLDRQAGSWLPRLGALMAGFFVPVAYMDWLTGTYQVPSGASFNFLNQLTSAYDYQSGVNHHAGGADEAAYYPLAILLVEGALASAVLVVSVAWAMWRWAQRPTFVMFILLVQVLGVVCIWSAAGALGAAKHLRVIVPCIPVAAMLIGAFLSEVEARMSRWAGRNGAYRPHAMATLAGLLVVLGWLNSGALMSVTTGYDAIRRDLGSPRETWVFGGKDRAWGALLASPGRTDAVAQSPSASVHQLDNPGDVVRPGGQACRIIVETHAEAAHKIWVATPQLAQKVQERLAAIEAVAPADPSLTAPATASSLPMFLLEGTDTPVRKVIDLIRNGTMMPESGEQIRVYDLPGGSGAGCVSPPSA
jgi:hypothetical protein